MTVVENQAVTVPASRREQTAVKKLSFAKRARVRQIRFCSRWLSALGGLPGMPAIFKAIRDLPPIRPVLAALAGYNRPFVSLQAAGAFIADFDGGGHSHPFCAINLMQTIEKASPSDYAALFFLQPLLPGLSRVFDFGGSVGNLFYCYSKYLHFRSDLVWTVHDVPVNVELGKQIAATQRANQLRFTSSLSDGDGADLFLATGVIHYFETPLADIIAGFQKKPRYVLINRSPLTTGQPFATVQDAGRYRVACLVHNQPDLVRRFAAVGYELVDSWSAAERTLPIPCYPDRSVAAYSGLFFRLRADA